MTKGNKIAKENLEYLLSKGFSFSYQKIADYLSDIGVVKDNGIPYARLDISTKLKSSIMTDENIIQAILKVKADVSAGLKRVWKYHQPTGAPRKTKKRDWFS